MRCNTAPRYTVARGVMPRKGVVQPDHSWMVYAIAASLVVANVLVFIDWLFA